MAIEHLLSKLTARGIPWDTVGGGLPETTAADVSAALSYMEKGVDRNRYIVLGAKYFDHNRVYETALLEIIRIQSWTAWRRWHKSNDKTRVSLAVNDGLARAVLCAYLRPRGRPPTDSELADIIGVHVNTYRLKYREHVSRLLGVVHQFEQSALSALRYRLRGD